MTQCVATVLIVLCGLLIFSHAKENQCPGNKASCPDVSTCCVLSNGSFGCCPIQNAVCCGDSVHCCPDGYTCDVIKGKCIKTAEHINMIENTPAVNTSIAGERTKGFQRNVVSQKMSALKVRDVDCPDGITCPDGSTCCLGPFFRPHPRYRCCPVPNASCCLDGIHCCRRPYRCSLSSKECRLGNQRVALLKKVPATKKRGFDSGSDGIVCPDKRHQCPKESACCILPSGTYGCCPFENAVGCNDDKHSCPEGYTCDLEAGKCSKTAEHSNVIKNIPDVKTSIGKWSKTAAHTNMFENIPAIKNSIAGECIKRFQTKEILQKIPSLKEKISAALSPPPVVCPDGSHCPLMQKCCPGPHRHGWRCCRYSSGNCCSDGLHCCPSGFICSPPSMGPICLRN